MFIHKLSWREIGQKIHFFQMRSKSFYHILCLEITMVMKNGGELWRLIYCNSKGSFCREVSSSLRCDGFCVALFKSHQRFSWGFKFGNWEKKANIPFQNVYWYFCKSMKSVIESRFPFPAAEIDCMHSPASAMALYFRLPIVYVTSSAYPIRWGCC